MKRILLAFLAAALLAAPDSETGTVPQRGVQLARAVRDAGLDAAACYRVRDLSIVRDDLRLYLTDGYLILGKPVEGRIFSAVFSAQTDTGDAELLLMPPTRSERESLARFADTPNLNEHFTTAALLFSDQTAVELLEQIRSTGARAAPEKGVLMAQQWGPVIQNLTGSVDMRLLEDHLNDHEGRHGIFYAAVSGRKTGNIDLVYDPQAREQITVGKLVYRDNRAFFDIWTAFTGRSFRQGRRQLYRSPLQLSDFRITADLDPALNMRCVTKFKLNAREAVPGAFAFEMTRRMKVTKALLDGRESEVFSRDSLRADLLRGGDNGVFLLMLDKPLTPGQVHEVEIHHEGNVVTDAGSGVYFVGARLNWYPNADTNFALYDMTFRHPAALNLVANGDIVEDKAEGEFRITRRRTSGPIRFAGFNLGEYNKIETQRQGLTVEVYSNRKIETALRQRPQAVVVQPPVWRRGAGQRAEVLTLPSTTAANPDPGGRANEIAADVAAALEFMSSRFGPPPLKTLTISPIPGVFGQGFPGLVYLSTLAYLNPSERPAAFRQEMTQLFYSDILEAHETAHQWWGNLVTAASYQDEWMMEALANYSALMFLEKSKGRRAIDGVLQEYKQHLLAKTNNDRTVESAGPIVWGIRLSSSQTPGAWRTITYEKGSWILHMLRSQMGDEAFTRMLGELTKRFRYQRVSTEQFRALARQFLPKTAADATLEGFFEQWVYGTGVPSLNLAHSVRGKAPKVTLRATITQSGVDEDFSAVVPVEIQLPGKRSVVRWVRTSSEPVTLTVDLKAAPVKVSLDPANTILRR